MSIERFEDLKAAVKARNLSQYAGKNLDALAADYQKDAQKLTTKTFLLARGAGNEDCRFPLRSTKQTLDQAIRKVRRPCSHGC
jgi:hypothetical protein